MWKTPKTDWTIDDRFNIEDYNRIKNNLNYLHEKSEEIYGEYSIADMGEDVLSHAGFWDVATFNEFESNLETINAHMINAEIGLKQTFYPNGVFIGFAELNRIEGATLTLKAVIDGWYEGMKVLSFRLGGSQIGSDRIQRKDSVVSIAVTGTENVHAYLDQPLDLTGLTVTATYKSGETQNVTSECVFNPANGTIMTQTGQQTISVSYTEDEKTVTTSFTVNVTIFVPSWSTATDAQIISALEAHYNGDIDLHEHWNVGDERVIHLSAIPEFNYGQFMTIDAQPEQDITMVIMQKGGKQLTSGTECAFVIGQKNHLSNKTAMCTNPNPSQSVKNIYYRWRDWFEDYYLEAFPSTIKSIFRKSPYYYTSYDTSNNDTEHQYFANPSEKEIFGTNTVSNDEGNNSTQIDFYKDVDNRDLFVGSWLRNESKQYATYFGYVVRAYITETTTNPEPRVGNAGTNKYNITPVGTI